jgi:predicted DNA-binding protein
MSTTIKRISLCLTKETQRQLDELSCRLGENQSQIITRALQAFYFEMLKEKG